MKYWKKLMMLSCIMVLAFSLTACANNAEAVSGTTGKEKLEDGSVNTTEETDAQEVATETPDAVEAKTNLESGAVTYPVTVKDSENNEVSFEQEPQRVISLAPNITEMMYQLGMETKLVGRTDYCDYPEAALTIESVGSLTEPDMEKIVSLEPDVVIASTHFSEESEAQLTDLGIKVLVLYEEHEIEGVYTMFETLGTVVNATDKSQAAIEEMKSEIVTVTGMVEGQTKPTVYYVVGFGEYGDYTAGGDTFISQLITLAGGENIAKEVQGWSYSVESLLEADPEIIVIDNSMKDAFMTADNYKDLTAVKNSKVFGIDKSILERQGFRNAEGIRTLAEIFHSDDLQP